jgi:hypothetical protein
MVVEPKSGSVDSDDISDSLDNRKIFEFVGIKNKSSIVTGVSLGIL